MVHLILLSTEHAVDYAKQISPSQAAIGVQRRAAFRVTRLPRLPAEAQIFTRRDRQSCRSRCEVLRFVSESKRHATMLECKTKWHRHESSHVAGQHRWTRRCLHSCPNSCSGMGMPGKPVPLECTKRSGFTRNVVRVPGPGAAAKGNVIVVLDLG